MDLNRQCTPLSNFAYLFPEQCKLIEELASAHFDKFSIIEISIEDKSSFNGWLSEHWDPVLVSGSFNRSGISELFKKSFVIETIRQHKASVFIAHH